MFLCKPVFNKTYIYIFMSVFFSLFDSFQLNKYFFAKETLNKDVSLYIYIYIYTHTHTHTHTKEARKKIISGSVK